MRKKSMIITGASRGIGRELSIYFGNKGYNLLLIARTETCLQEVQNKVLTNNPSLIINYLATDIYTQEPLGEAIHQFYNVCEGIDVLINNAGYVKRGTSALPSNELEEMINTNLIGSINMIRFIVPKMKQSQSGNIINICSRNAKTPRSFLGGYAATKAALLAYSESLYKELSPSGIKVTALCPGFVDTEMTQDIEVERDKLIQPSEICKSIEFILSLSKAVAIRELNFESIIQVGEYC